MEVLCWLCFFRLMKELFTGRLLKSLLPRSSWTTRGQPANTYRHPSTFQTIQLEEYNKISLRAPAMHWYTMHVPPVLFPRVSTSISQELLLFLEGPVWMILALERCPFKYRDLSGLHIALEWTDITFPGSTICSYPLHIVLKLQLFGDVGVFNPCPKGFLKTRVIFLSGLVFSLFQEYAILIAVGVHGLAARSEWWNI